MTRDEAKEIFRLEAARCGLDFPTTWRFGISTRRRMGCGVCKYNLKLIELGALHVERDSDEEVRDTILHEIAHALTGREYTTGRRPRCLHHGPKWRKKAREIGCTAMRCSKTSGHGRHTGKCDKCAYEFTRSKNPVSTIYLGDCNRCGMECTRHKRPRTGATFTHTQNRCGGTVTFTRSRKEAATYTHLRCGGTIRFADRGVQYEGRRQYTQNPVAEGTDSGVI